MDTERTKLRRRHLIPSTSLRCHEPFQEFTRMYVHTLEAKVQRVESIRVKRGEGWLNINEGERRKTPFLRGSSKLEGENIRNNRMTGLKPSCVRTKFSNNTSFHLLRFTSLSPSFVYSRLVFFFFFFCSSDEIEVARTEQAQNYLSRSSSCVGVVVLYIPTSFLHRAYDGRERCRNSF